MMINPQKILHLAVTIAAVLLSGCSQEETPGDSGKHPLVLQATIAAQDSRASTTLQTDKVDAKVTLGVFATDAGGNVVGKNVPYSYDSETGQWKASGSAIYFPMDGKSINIEVYAPYDASITTIPAVLTPKSDQSSDADYLASDLLGGSLNNVGYNATAVDVTLQHLMAKVTVIITAGGGVTNADIEGAKLEIGGIKATLPTGETSASVIVKPGQTVAAGTEFFTIELASMLCSYVLPGDLSLDKGKEYIYRFTITGTELEFDSMSVTDWSAGTTGEDNSIMLPGDE